MTYDLHDQGNLKIGVVETIEMLERRSLEFPRVHETRFKGNSVRIMSGKAAEYQPFEIVNKKGWSMNRVYNIIEILLTYCCFKTLLFR